MPFPLLAAVPIASGLIKSITGGGQKSQGKKLLAQLGEQPIEQLPEEYQQNENLATQMAATGMPSEQYNQAMRNIQRQQLTALRYATDRRSAMAVLPQVLQGTNDATLNLDVANAKERTANQRNLINVNNQVGGVKRQLFQQNILNPYLRKYNYAMELQGAGNQNFVGGLDQIVTGGLAALGYNKNKAGQDGTGGY